MHRNDASFLIVWAYLMMLSIVLAPVLAMWLAS